MFVVELILVGFVQTSKLFFFLLGLSLLWSHFYRYPPHGRRAMAIETSVPWERLRAPPVETPPHDLHISDCLHELCPGDHIEIQWRRNKEFPYGWSLLPNTLFLFYCFFFKFVYELFCFKGYIIHMFLSCLILISSTICCFSSLSFLFFLFFKW